MKVLIQRVSQAKVTVEQNTVGSIEAGYLVYVCFEVNDTHDKIDQAIYKIVNLRIFEDQDRKMNKNIVDINGAILSISQFTLSWDGRKGHRPSFDRSMPPQEAKIFYKLFNDKIKEQGIKVEAGIFGTDMIVDSINDGPVTFFLEF